MSGDILIVHRLFCLFQYSPSFSDDEQPTFELWVATSNARHSVATIIDYSGKFTNIEVTITHTVIIVTFANMFACLVLLCCHRMWRWGIPLS